MKINFTKTKSIIFISFILVKKHLKILKRKEKMAQLRVTVAKTSYMGTLRPVLTQTSLFESGYFKTRPGGGVKCENRLNLRFGVSDEHDSTYAVFP